MGDSQVPWGLDALNGAVSNASWKSKPTWYLVATDDKMIPPGVKRAGATVAEAKGSHAIYASQPEVVADLIAQAAEGDDKSAVRLWAVIGGRCRRRNEPVTKLADRYSAGPIADEKKTYR
jgi:hypothetical protein